MGFQTAVIGGRFGQTSVTVLVFGQLTGQIAFCIAAFHFIVGMGFQTAVIGGRFGQTSVTVLVLGQFTGQVAFCIVAFHFIVGMGFQTAVIGGFRNRLGQAVVTVFVDGLFTNFVALCVVAVFHMDMLFQTAVISGIFWGQFFRFQRQTFFSVNMHGFFTNQFAL